MQLLCATCGREFESEANVITVMDKAGFDTERSEMPREFICPDCREDKSLDFM